MNRGEKVKRSTESEKVKKINRVGKSQKDQQSQIHLYFMSVQLNTGGFTGLTVSSEEVLEVSESPEEDTSKEDSSSVVSSSSTNCVCNVAQERAPSAESPLYQNSTGASSPDLRHSRPASGQLGFNC